MRDPSKRGVWTLSLYILCFPIDLRRELPFSSYLFSPDVLIPSTTEIGLFLLNLILFFYFWAAVHFNSFQFNLNVFFFSKRLTSSWKWGNWLKMDDDNNVFKLPLNFFFSFLVCLAWRPQISIITESLPCNSPLFFFTVPLGIFSLSISVYPWSSIFCVCFSFTLNSLLSSVVKKTYI